MKQQGQIIIIALVFVGVVTALVASLVGYTLIQLKAHRQALGRVQGLSIAEAGAEAALWKLNNQAGYVGEANTAYGAGTYTVTITNISGSSKLIKVDSYIPNSSTPKSHRVVQVTVTVGTTNIGFNYGVQAGEGGFDMDNNSQVTGNIYANGDVTGTGTVTGDVIVAGGSGKIVGVTVTGNGTAHNITGGARIGGNAYATLITGNSRITGNASVDALNSCTVTGNAVYNSRASCNVSGTTTTPNNNVPADQPIQPLPIDSDQITEWENDAASGGTIGSQTINGNASLGPVKINGNLVINNGGILTLNGTVWVTGNISISNGATVKLSAAYGSLSGTLLAGTSGSNTLGNIDISNGAILQGSGTAGSYVLLLSEMDSTTATAISVANNATGAIIYAGTGVVDVFNNAQLKEITAERIHLNNNAVVTYNSGLASASFTSGPAGGWEISTQSWQLLQ